MLIPLKESDKPELVSKFQTNDLDQLFYFPDKHQIFSFSEKEDVHVVHGIYDDRRVKHTPTLHVIDSSIVFSNTYKIFSIGGTSYIVFLESLFIVKNNMLATYPPSQSYFYLYNKEYQKLIKSQISCPQLDEILENHNSVT